MRRVVITGTGIVSCIGNDKESVARSLREGRSGIRQMPHWADWKDLHTRVGAPVEGFDEKAIPREFRRSMGRLALLAAAAMQQAVAESKLSPDLLKSGRVGLSIGQTVGSPSATGLYFDTLKQEVAIWKKEVWADGSGTWVDPLRSAEGQGDKVKG